MEKENEEIKPKKKHHVRGIWAMTIILIMAAVLGGTTWYLLFSNFNNSTSFVLNLNHKAKVEEKKKSDEHQGLKEYQNVSAMFSFWYPEAWALEEQNNALILSSDKEYPKAYLTGEGPETKNSEIYIQIHFSNQAIDISREAPSIKPKFSTVKIGGVEAKKVTYKNEDIFQEIVQNFQAGDFYFLIICDTKSANSDKIDAYNKMLESFKFGKEAI